MTANIAIIDSGGANIASIQFALDRLNVQSFLTQDTHQIEKASHIILPGVGAAADAMKKLSATDGLIECIKSLKQPVIGICLGMQLLFEHSEEGNVDMLGLIKGKVKKFIPKNNMTIPHMGWNTAEIDKKTDLLKGINHPEYFYFVHSYRADINNYTIGRTTYGDPFTSIVQKDNFMGCQFHPERSSQAGAKILENFCNL